ncbi:hypothetical protein [Amycolatopsis taiwanensis]|uniref:Uncharacterized protein n=1 Tax=Amycolatopsis taiwanensis TaxID=342230 RepID=A0A9W6R602_9PSEU|nr:hypothetical protein [Amycolatopsis taiwanensis]GLY70069.1 hypothetical protein Atai01_66880 [Amycolatopsis taiwanensis]
MTAQTLTELEHARAVADAILYEGYLLYPYRRSSGKNRVRWQFGVLVPRPWLSPAAAADDSVAGSADAWRQQTECLLEASASATVHMRLRFLQVRHRSVESAVDGGFRPVSELTVDGRRHLTFDDAVPRDYDVVATAGELLRDPHVAEVTVPGGEEVERLGEAGRIVRTWWPLRLRVRVSARPARAPFPLLRLRCEVENTAEGPERGAPRPEALRFSLVATHSLILVRGGSFLSLLDPPEWAAAAARECHNVHTFPVLVGPRSQRDVVLSTPILMEDHPRVSPESPGDLFDATEIDEILSLRTLTLTDEEKREARATDPRAAAIIDRIEGIPPEVMDRLHGTVRSLRPADEPPTGSVVVDGVLLSQGSRVRLRPRPHGTDAHDMFLDGRIGVVEKVLTDVDGARQVAVTLADDPGADLHRWYGRFHYFSPEELRPEPDPAPDPDPDREPAP